MLGVEFSRNQRLALYALIGMSAIGLSYATARDTVGGQPGEVVLMERGDPRVAVVASGSDPLPGQGVVGAGTNVVFQVAGCVNKPGVYRLPQGQRVINAVTAAGGAKPSADLQAMNLAAKIEDGSRIYVPSRDETAASQGRVFTGPVAGARAITSTARCGGASSDKLRMAGEGAVNINTAGAEELQRLPGVGPATAAKIMEYRSQIGRFRSAGQLMDVKGIGPKKLEKMRPFVKL